MINCIKHWLCPRDKGDISVMNSTSPIVHCHVVFIGNRLFVQMLHLINCQSWEESSVAMPGPIHAGDFRNTDSRNSLYQELQSNVSSSHSSSRYESEYNNVQSTVGNILKIIKIDKCEQLLQFYTFLCVNKSVIHFTNVTCCCLQNLKFLKLLYTVLAERVRYFAFSDSATLAMNWYFVFLKSWSIIKTRDRFGICWSWRFQNTPYMSSFGWDIWG